MTRFGGLLDMLSTTAPYWGLFVGSLVLSLVLTPIVRSVNIRLGIVDRPDERRINKSTIPRAGGVAVIAAFVISLAVFELVSEKSVSAAIPSVLLWRLMALSVGIGALGFVDDMFGIRPLVKLAGQVAIATLAFFFCDIGMHTIFPSIPRWLDLPLTVFWITGAINAFNLIDGLDGLASGLAVIAATGMAGTLFFTDSPGQIFLHLAFIGSVLGFLRYNFNPASIFLGDTGSMFIGFVLAVVPLAMRTGDSLLVGMGVPLLAMGVPIFDTSLAIIRRTVRALLKKEEHVDAGGTKVMQPDLDHVHHRLLRKFVSQRKTAGVMYAFAMFLVAVGICGVALEDRAAGLFIIAFVVAVVVVVRDMSRIELWDAGRLADKVAHANIGVRRRRSTYYVPLLVVADILILSVSWYLTLLVLNIHPSPRSFHTFLPIRVVPVFLSLACFRTYATVWGRAMLSNYARLIIAVVCGMLASLALMLLLKMSEGGKLAFTVVHFGLSVILLMAVRSVRQFGRDCFYLVSSRRLADDPGVSRTLVFGAGLRYRAFRRELVRKIMDEKRIIVGLVDDDILLRGKCIGGITVDGPHMDAKRIVARTRADSVVIACELHPERFRAVVDAFRACGLKISHFTFSEKPV